MKTTIRNHLTSPSPARFWTTSCRAALLGLAALGLAAPVQAQTGAYTLNSGTTSVSSLTENTSVSNQSGIFVYNSASLTVGTVAITTSGDSTNTTASDQYGGNAGILAGSISTKGTVFISGSTNTVVTSGAVANGLFATYTGSSVTMLGGSIICSGSNAHGVDATYGGAVTLSNVNVTSYGQNSSAVATDYGGGTVTVVGGLILASNVDNGGHSAGVYSTGTITVKNATVTSKGDNGGVIDGANAIILTNTVMAGVLNGFKIHNTSGASGSATIIVNGGSLTGSGGDGFYLAGSEASAVTANITVLSNAVLTTSSGNLLNLDGGSTATFTVINDTLIGNVLASGTNTATVSLQGSTLTGCVNAAKQLLIDASSTWNATSNSVVNNALTNAGTIHLAGLLTCTNVILKTNACLGGGGRLSSNLTVNAGATLILNPATNFIVGGKVIFAGAVTVAPSTNTISAGTYKLLTYSNSLSGSPSFTYSAPSGSGQTAAFNTATAGVIYVTLTVPATTPAAPANLTAAAGDAQVTLTWNAVTNATNYYLKRSLVSGGSYSAVNSGTGTNFVNSGLTNGALYYFVVSATNSAGESADSAEVSARPIATVATNLTLTTSARQLQITWPADHTGWKLQAQTNTLGAGLGTNWADVADSTLTNQMSLSATATNASVFYRLAKP